jgi:hypothetical protein
MKMDVVSYDDDTGVVTIDLDEEAKQYLIERGFNEVLKTVVEHELKEIENVKDVD